jgi:hypothetical protein
VDHAGGLVNIAPAKRAELAEAQSSVVRESPCAAILFRCRGDDASSVGRIARVQALAAVRGQDGPAGRVVIHAPEHEEATVDRAHRVHDVGDGRPGVAFAA